MKIIFLGDSTMQYNDASTYPQVGWPQGLTGQWKENVEVLNFAKNGRSTKSFIEEGIFTQALKEVDENSIVIIQFGHNDEHTHQPERFTRPFVEYKDNLTWMYQQIHEKKAEVLFLTPICRRHFNEDGTFEKNQHEQYAEAMRQVSEQCHCPLIDMTALTTKALAQLGDKASQQLFMIFPAGCYENYPEGKNDNTHLRQKGANLISDLFKTETIKMNHSICKAYR